MYNMYLEIIVYIVLQTVLYTYMYVCIYMYIHVRTVRQVTCITLIDEALEHYQCSPALVRGEKEMELALSEGKKPVIDILTDVFAIISASGKIIHY